MLKISKLNRIGIALATPEEAFKCTNMPCDPLIKTLDPPAGRCENPTVFIAYRVSDDLSIGSTILYNYNIQKGTIEYGCRIWDSINWNKGYGVEMTILTCDYAFTNTTVKTVNLKVLPTNTHAIKCYETAGFRFKQNEMIDGIAFDRMIKKKPIQ